MRRRPPAIAAGEGLTLPDRPRPAPAGHSRLRIRRSLCSRCVAYA